MTTSTPARPELRPDVDIRTRSHRIGCIGAGAIMADQHLAAYQLAGFPVVAMFLATSLGLPFEAVGLLIAVDWFAGIFRTFLNVNGDTVVAMLVANATDEIDRDVYDGRKQVTAEEFDAGAYSDTFARADSAD